MRLSFLFLLSCVCSAGLFAQGKPDSLLLQTAVTQYVQEQGFSGTILVAKAGQPVFHRSYGLGYYATPDTIENEYHYSIASMTKLFTSIRVLQLVEGKKVSLDKPLTLYLPAYAALISDQITVHHLLLHLSGLPNESDKGYSQPLSPDEVVQETLKRKRKTEIGTFNYNNLDYVLLGLLIEKVSGLSWQENIEAHILRPLQMSETGFLKYGKYPANFAYSYSQQKGQLKQDSFFYIENFYAAGNMYATTSDLLKLDQALYTSELLNESSQQLLSQSYPEYNYAGYGVWNYQYPFVADQPTVMERRGGIQGANVVLVRLTDSNYTIIILSNDSRFNPDSFGDEKNLRERLIRALY